MRLLILVLAVLLPLMGCASPDPSMERQADTLHTPEMEAAIKAAKPGEPRS